MLVFSPQLLNGIAKICREQQIHLIYDEIMTGFWRTGKEFAFQYCDHEPDFICLMKGLTAGWLPFSAVLTTNEIYQNFYGKYDHLVPPAACEHLTRQVGSADVEDICLETGHIGIYVSSKCQREFTPKIAQWMKTRDAIKRPAAKRRKAPQKAAAKRTRKKTVAS